MLELLVVAGGSVAVVVPGATLVFWLARGLPTFFAFMLCFLSAVSILAAYLFVCLFYIVDIYEQLQPLEMLGRIFLAVFVGPLMCLFYAALLADLRNRGA